MSDTLHPLASAYLERLRRESRRLPRDRRRELVAEVEAHLYEAIPAGASDGDVHQVLDRLGPPRAMVIEEMPRKTVADGSNWREIAAILLLMFGGFIFFVGWVAGAALLWSSQVWTLRDKLIGTLVIPGGLLAARYVLLIPGSGGPMRTCSVASGLSGLHTHCQPGTGTNVLAAILLAAVVLAPIGSGVYLAMRFRLSPGRLIVASA